MATLRPTVASWAELLRETMTARGISRRRLARMVAERTGNREDSERPAIYRYLKGMLPEPERAALFAVILDEPRLADVPQEGERRRLRLAEVAELAAVNEENQRELRRVVESVRSSVQELRNALEARLDQLEQRVRALEN